MLRLRYQPFHYYELVTVPALLKAHGSGCWFTFLCSVIYRYTSCNADPPSNKSYSVSERFSISKLIPTRGVNHPLPMWLHSTQRKAQYIRNWAHVITMQTPDDPKQGAHTRSCGLHAFPYNYLGNKTDLQTGLPGFDSRQRQETHGDNITFFTSSIWLGRHAVA
jgi:hypothetical protein